MTLTAETRSVQRKKPVSTSLCPTQTDLGSNPGIRGEREANKHLAHGTAFHFDTHLKTSSYFMINTVRLLRNINLLMPFREKNNVQRKKNIKILSALCGLKREFLKVKAGGTRVYHRISNCDATMPKHRNKQETKFSVPVIALNTCYPVQTR